MNALMERLQPLVPYTPHLAALVIAVLLGLGIAHLETQSPAAAGGGGEQWVLPAWKPFRVDPQLKAMAAAKVWVEEAAAPTTAAARREARTANQWKFVGTVTDGETLLAVIELPEAGKTQRLNVGQALPDGSIVTAIDIGEITATLDGESRILRLFDDAAKPAPPRRNPRQQPRRPTRK